MMLWTTPEQLPYRVSLCDLRTPSIRRHVSLVFRSDGDFVIEGYECGPEVESRTGSSVFEWLRIVRAEHLPVLFASLGLSPTTASIEELRSRFSGPAAGSFDGLVANAVPSELHLHSAA